MVETEERKIKEREKAAHEQEERDAKAGRIKHKKHHHNEAEQKSENKDGGKEKAKK